MMSTDEARRVLGVGPSADREELRAAFRSRMRELHPDLSGDDSPAGQAAARDVIDAYRCLFGATIARADPTSATRPPRRDDLVDPNESETLQRGPNPRLVQVMVASVLVLGTIVVLSFFLVAFSQSGR